MFTLVFRLPYLETAFTISIGIFYALKTRLVYNLAVLSALYPRFYVIKSAYANNEYRF